VCDSLTPAFLPVGDAVVRCHLYDERVASDAG
jgi:hypothetical protein